MKGVNQNPAHLTQVKEVRANIALDLVLARAGVHAAREVEAEVVLGFLDGLAGVADQVEDEVGATDVAERVGDPKAPGLLVDVHVL